MKIAVYAIAKNEEQHVARWAASCEDADYRVVVDTGSEDGTYEALVAIPGLLAYQVPIFPFRFDTARNRALDMVPADADVCLVMDMDEVLAPGWREALEAAWTPDTTRLRHPLIADHAEDGSDGSVVMRMLAHTRFGYRWQFMCHEALRPEPGMVDVVTPCMGLVTHHWPDHGKSRAAYLDMLRECVEENPGESWCKHYYGRELYYHERHKEALAYLVEHIRTSSDSIQKSESLRIIAMMNAAGREQLLLRAISEAPLRREPWVDLAMHYADDEDWAPAYAAVNRALSLHDKTIYITQPYAWNDFVHQLSATCREKLLSAL
jgi:glycosyltransferase involved in cell wall biosynthesis